MLAIAMLEERFTSGRGKEFATHETMMVSIKGLVRGGCCVVSAVRGLGELTGGDGAHGHKEHGEEAGS